MKHILLKIYGEEDIYYDLTTNQYKKKAYCSKCGKRNGCLCYDELYDAQESGAGSLYCSDRCYVLDNKDDLEEIAAELGITIKPTMEEWNASKITKKYIEDADLDIPDGEPCRSGR